ncbi:MAG TPA: S53 family peptidase [Acidobacteriaceae bacterium]|nr:S53 family peptidase [Acidobacteriaceae bacterium]
MFKTPLNLSALAAALVLTSTALSAQTKQPMLLMGPRAVSTQTVATSDRGTSYGLFTCQLPGSFPVCYDPYQMRAAYGTDKLIAEGYDGKGKTIVIIDAFQSPDIAYELKYFDGFYGLPSLNGLGGPANANQGTFRQVAPQGLTPFNQTDGNQIGWAEEISLDVLYAHAIAPGANITLVLAASNSDADILSATKYAVDNRLGDVISQSYGGNESCESAAELTAEHEIFAEATSKNMTLFASAGDSGSAQVSCDGSSYVKAVSSPASDPLVTAVGGTELHAAPYFMPNEAPGTYQGEIVWNEAYVGINGAGGGGFSVVFDEPSYQKPALPGGKQRGVADVSYNAAVLHGLLLPIIIPGINTINNPLFYLFGGTSAGSPQWSAITAIADQEAGQSLGYLNTAFYHIGDSPSQFMAAFHDVTSGNNSLFGIPGYSAGPGWDPPTGLGSPQAVSLARMLNVFVSPGDGTAAIAGSAAHGKPNAPGNGHMTPH